MEVAWEALLAQAQANRGNAAALEEQARANRVMAEVLLGGMQQGGCCGVPPGSDERQAWLHDAHGVAAVGEAIVSAAASVEAFTLCDPGEFVEGGSGGGKWQCGTKRTPSVLELLCQKSLKSSVYFGGCPPYGEKGTEVEGNGEQASIEAHTGGALDGASDSVKAACF